MNRYPWWKYAILAFALALGLLYTVPNLYGEAPAVQVSSGKASNRCCEMRRCALISFSSMACRCVPAMATPTRKSVPRTH